ncbi:PKD domain-containing protein [Hahella sp. KA22]|uniref:PKD domain-containing protein n=1 Tax=Hahella sp. KA22 TaxID=1628392 RepID=UPI000FDDEAFD|nr:PKD domain-containing protein [Hahella sp. KA22]AZZ95227.1 PKD domain-containing protein [Hahella sp. KA22]QAY52872.1 PKD domain-containing protein [Hahella sp. KA22]
MKTKIAWVAGLALSLTLSANLQAASDDAIAAPQPPITIASETPFKGLLTDERQLRRESVAAYQAVSDRRIKIHKENASFIKVHFSRFDIPEGSYVVVRNAQGDIAHRYGGDNPSLHTLREGDDGATSFAALSVIGSTAIVEYFPGVSSQTSYSIEVDTVMEGFPQEEIDELMSQQTSGFSTCGVNERRDVQCWADSHPEEYERTRPVARILVNGSSLCTAWRVGPDNRIFTNNHCVSSQSGVANTEVWFNYQRTSCGSGSLAGTKVVTGASMLATNYELDYTLFTVNNFSSIQSFGYFGLDVRPATNQERIYIPQHGSGNPKELSIESDQNSGGLCRVDQPSVNGRGTGTDMGYNCDTIGGSSGSPVLAGQTNRVIALHHFGGCPNQGVLIHKIWPQVASYFNNQIPAGDNETPNGDPVADFSFSVAKLEVRFSDESSDSDGEIVSWQWDFGDGNSSISRNPTHTYASAGGYSVSLNVTDNDGNTASKTQTVSVGDTPRIEEKNLSDNTGDWKHFKLSVPSGMSKLTATTSGGSGDADLYVRQGAQPTTSQYNCRPYTNGNNEVCTINNPAAGDWYISIRAYRDYSGVDLVGELE